CVLECGGGRGRARDSAAEEEREREETVHEPGQQPSPGKPADARVELALLALGQLALTGERMRALLQIELSDEAQVEERPERRIAPLYETVDRERTLRDPLLVKAVGNVQPQAAPTDVTLDVHREELLALRVADDRLERPKDLDVRRCRLDSGLCDRGGHSGADAHRMRPGHRAV